MFHPSHPAQIEITSAHKLERERGWPSTFEIKVLICIRFVKKKKKRQLIIQTQNNPANSSTNWISSTRWIFTLKNTGG